MKDAAKADKIAKTLPPSRRFAGVFTGRHREGGDLRMLDGELRGEIQSVLMTVCFVIAT